MKLHAAWLAVLLILPGQAGGSLVQDAPANARPQQSLTGCIDQQDGQYVLLDDHMLKITNLQSAGSEKEVFAKYIGRTVQVRGARTSGQDGAFKVTSIAEVAGTCHQAK